jgi:hypothetical protein
MPGEDLLGSHDLIPDVDSTPAPGERLRVTVVADQVTGLGQRAGRLRLALHAAPTWNNLHSVVISVVVSSA